MLPKNIQFEKKNFNNVNTKLIITGKNIFFNYTVKDSFNSFNPLLSRRVSRRGTFKNEYLS